MALTTKNAKTQKIVYPIDPARPPASALLHYKEGNAISGGKLLHAVTNKYQGKASGSATRGGAVIHAGSV